MQQLDSEPKDWLEELDRKMWQARMHQLRQELRQERASGLPRSDRGRPTRPVPPEL